MIAIGKLILPDERKIIATEKGTFDYIDNTWIGDGDIEAIWVNTDEPLIEEEISIYADRIVEWELDYSYEEDPYDY